MQYALENLVINETVIPAASGGGGDGNKSSKASVEAAVALHSLLVP